MVHCVIRPPDSPCLLPPPRSPTPVISVMHSFFCSPSVGIPMNRYKQRIFTLACAFALFAVVVFFTAFTLQYITLRNTTFISATETEGCSPVLATLNGNYRFDGSGNWQTSALVRLLNLWLPTRVLRVNFKGKCIQGANSPPLAV